MVCDPSAKEVFDLLLTSLKDNKTIHLHIIWSTMSLQIVAIGWLVTSENARAYLAKNKKVIWFSLLAIVVLLVAHIGMIYESFRVTEGLVNAIRSNAFFQECLKIEQVYSLYSIKLATVLIRLLFTSVLFAILTILITINEGFNKKT